MKIKFCTTPISIKLRAACHPKNMKAGEIIFPRPLRIIQAYCHTYVYAKNERSYAVRKENTAWDIESKIGFVSNDRLHLPETFFEDLNLDDCILITMEDYYYNKRGPRGGPMPSGLNRSFNIGTNGRINIFQLHLGNGMELYLDADDKYCHPKRDRFKVCELRLHQPVEIKLNYKTFDLNWDTDRMLIEESFIYEYVGDFTSCKLLREPYDYVKKSLPPNRKLVDLRQNLWM